MKMQLENITECKLPKSIVTGINSEIERMTGTINSLLIKPVTQGEMSNKILKCS